MPVFEQGFDADMSYMPDPKEEKKLEDEDLTQEDLMHI